MAFTGSQTFVLRPQGAGTFGWYCDGSDVQAVASARAIPKDPVTGKAFPVDGAVISLSGPIYYYVGPVDYLAKDSSVEHHEQYIVRWQVTNMTDEWRAIKLSYTIVASTPLVTGVTPYQGGE